MNEEELRLHALAMVAVDAILAHPDYTEDDRIVVIIRNEDEGGALVGGYETEGEQLTHQAAHQVVEDTLHGLQVIAASQDIGITLIQPGMN